jgi:hypothetical protein
VVSGVNSALEERIVLITVADGKEKLYTTPMTSARSLTLSPDGRYVAYDAPDKTGSASRW